MSVGIAHPMGGTIIQARPFGIPWRSLQEWLDRNAYSGLDREFVAHLVGVLDREFLAHWVRQQGKPRQEPMDDKLARWDAAEGA